MACQASKWAFGLKNDFGQVKQAEIFYEGVVPNLERRYRETASDYIREMIEGFMSSRPCPVCKGKRLKPESLAVRVGGCSIAEVTDLSIADCLRFFEQLQLADKDVQIAHLILKEIAARLGFLRDVGLNYLTLARSAGSLSGGEAQRIRLATQIGLESWLG